MYERKLPFTLQQVLAIKWAEDSCIVSYDADGKTRTKKVSLPDMEEIRSDFKHFLICATKCVEYEGHKRKAVAARIKWWDKLLNGRSAAAHILARGNVHPWESISNFTFGIGKAAQPKDRPYCSMSFGNGSAGTFDCALLDANCPGFTEFCTILCVENTFDSREVFSFLSELPQRFSYECLEAEVQHFAIQLRACAPLGMSLDAMLGVLVSSVDTKTAAAADLPELAVEMAL